MKQIYRSLFLFTLILTAWTAMPTLLAQPTPAMYRGKFVRKEIRRTIIKPTFICTLTKGASPFVAFEFWEQHEITYFEVNIYQAMQEVVREKNADGLDVVKDFAPIPGQFIKDNDEIPRQEIQIKGLLANEKFSILGKEYVTDNKGRIYDLGQSILDLFDTMDTRSFELAISHATLGEQVVTLTRNLISRQNPVIPGNNAASQYDILEAFGLNFTQQMQCGRNGLKVKVTTYGEITAGKRVAIVVDVTNSDSKPVSNLIARSFSRHQELNGKLFYFGLVTANQPVQSRRHLTLPPGVDGTSPFYKAFAGLSRHPWRKDQLFYAWLPVTDRPARFVRYVTIPTAVNAGQPLHLSIAFWDIIGAIPEKRQDLSLTIPAK